VRWIDGHCHLADPRLAGKLDDVLAASREAGVDAWVQGGVSPEDWDRQLALKRKLAASAGSSAKHGKGPLLTSFGLHPWWVAQAAPEDVEAGLQTLARRLPEADALGELGLDLTEKHAASLALQSRAFREQLGLAKSAGKPLVLHIVRAHTQAIEILTEFQPFPAGGLVHSFSASRETAKVYVGMGFLLSISGVITRPGFQTLKRALTGLPSESLVLETDSPDQPLEGSSGLNTPARLLDVARAVAALRNQAPEELLEASTGNLKRLFGVSA
jgi:TatD DNase family protein